MNQYYKTLNLEGFGPRSQEEYIKFSKFMSSFNIPKKEKEKRCFVCKKKGIKYCNSHTIPQFILRNITHDGKLWNTQIFNSAKFINKEANRSGFNPTKT